MNWKKKQQNFENRTEIIISFLNFFLIFQNRKKYGIFWKIKIGSFGAWMKAKVGNKGKVGENWPKLWKDSLKIVENWEKIWYKCVKNAWNFSKITKDCWKLSKIG